MPASIKNIKSIINNQKGSSVLAQWPGDRLFYTVKVIKLDEEKRKVRVAYEDKTECWSNLKDVQIQFDEVPEDDLIVCCICDCGESGEQNCLVICDTCQQSYHQKCHEPHLSEKVLEDGIEWDCNTCKLIIEQTEGVKKPKVVNATRNNTLKKLMNTTITKTTKAKTKPTIVADKKQKQLKTKLPKLGAKGEKVAKSKENETPPPTNDEMMDVMTQDDDGDKTQEL